MTAPPRTTRETVLELVALGYTDQRIAEFLCIHPSLVGLYRRKAGRSRPPIDRYKTALPTGELQRLRTHVRASLGDSPAPRGLCPACREWLLLTDGLLPAHNRRVVGLMRHQSPRCDWSGCMPPPEAS